MDFRRFKKCPPSSQITDIGVQMVLRGCKKLEKLSLRGCYSITSSALEVLRYPGLRDLDLARCTSINNSALEHISTQCPNLESLNLYFVQQISDQGLFQLAARCKKLAFLNLAGCSQVTDQGLLGLAESGSLTSVCLMFCPRLTENAIQRVRNCNIVCER